MNMKLYEIDNAIMDAIEQAIDPDTGEINEEAYAQLEALEMAKGDKVENCLLRIKNLEVLLSGVEGERKNLQAREKAIKADIEWLKGYVVRSLAGEPFETAKVKVGYRSSEQLIVDNLDAIPAEYKKAVTEYKPDKTALKAAIKDGQTVAGCHIEEKVNLQIK